MKKMRIVVLFSLHVVPTVVLSAPAQAEPPAAGPAPGGAAAPQRPEPAAPPSAVLCLLLVLLSASSCAFTVEAARARAQERIDQLTKRASFDLECPALQLHVTCLSGESDTSGVTLCNTAGVRGCGRKATYVRVFGVESSRWLMNGGVE
jgi:hypothetical protein